MLHGDFIVTESRASEIVNFPVDHFLTFVLFFVLNKALISNDYRIVPGFSTKFVLDVTYNGITLFAFG